MAASSKLEIVDAWPKGLRDCNSAAGIEKWEMTLKRLFDSKVLPDLFIEEMRASDIEAWKDEVAPKVRAREYSPNTANTWLAVLKVIMGHAKVDMDLDANIAEHVKCFPLGDHRTYTREEPNSLTPTELGEFLAAMFRLHPQHFAITYMGFALGLRPSSLRPLRRKGPQADVKWDEQLLLIRRSHTRGQAIMNRTKTKADVEITVPALLLDVLRWHVDTQILTSKERSSDLLFPREDGLLHCASSLRKPFDSCAKEIGLKKQITPRGMRRSFQDLARSAEVRDVVTRSISGHATEQMQRHYSTVEGREQSEGLDRILSLMPAPAIREAVGEHRGEHAAG